VNDSVPTEQLLSADEMNTELSLAKHLNFPAITEGDAMAEAEVQFQLQVLTFILYLSNSLTVFQNNVHTFILIFK
jgi:hypothetical protein